MAAPTGSAAFNIMGETLHRLVGMGIGNKDESLSEAKKKMLQSRFSNLLCLIIDERSLLSANDLGKAEKRIKATIHSGLGYHNKMFGGLPVLLLVGDDYQLPAHDGIIQVMNKQSLKNNEANGFKILMKCGEKVMNLQTSRRIADSQEDQKTLLQKIRFGAMDLTADEVKKLQSLRLENIEREHGNQAVQCIKKDAVFLSYTNTKKDARNLSMLRTIATPANPVAIIRPRSTGKRAGKAYARHFSGKQKNTSSFLCIGAKVALDAVNYVPAWGLYNEACGTVDEIIFARESNPNDGHMPLYVVVDFPSYSGPIWDNQNPTHVPVPNNKIFCNSNCCSREFCPLVLAWGITVHRFEGQSAGPVDPGKIPNAYKCVVFDPHDYTAEKLALGLFYTGVSRATTLGDDTGLNSALFFEGKEATARRMQFLGRKVNSTDYYASFIKRQKWVDYLQTNSFAGDMTEAEISHLLAWIETASFEPGHVQRAAIKKQMHRQMNTFNTTAGGS